MCRCVPVESEKNIHNDDLIPSIVSPIVRRLQLITTIIECMLNKEI